MRQIAFHRFETRFHAQRRHGELAADDIGAIWLDVMGESLGPAVSLNPGYEVYWAYVSHFVHAPFYVYAYAFGNLLVEALMEARRSDPHGLRAALSGVAGVRAARAPMSRRCSRSGSTRGARLSGTPAARGWSGWWTNSKR